MRQGRDIVLLSILFFFLCVVLVSGGILWEL